MKKKQYHARRRQHHRSQLLHKYLTMHTTWWALAYAILLIITASFVAQTQILKDKNDSLTKQLAAKTASDNSCRTVGSWSAGELRQVSLTSGGLARNYLLHIPQRFSPSQYYPLVLFYSGKGATASGVEIAYGLDALPAIVAYPAPTIGTSDLTAWQGAPYSSGADDVAFTVDVLNDIQSKLCINRSRVYAAGFSNGGGFTALLSCKLPGRFAAYAVIAGALYPPENNCKPPAPAPLMSVHGTGDPIVPYSGSLSRQLPAIDAWTGNRAADNGCADEPTTYQTGSVVVATWHDCQRDATVQNVRIEGGSHKWGDISNNTLWDFLSKFSL